MFLLTYLAITENGTTLALSGFRIKNFGNGGPAGSQGDMGDMIVKCWGIMFLLSFAALASNPDLHFRPKSPWPMTVCELKARTPARVTSEGQQLERLKLKRRIEWLETLKTLVYYRQHGKTIFPYTQKIETLKTRLKTLEERRL